MATLACDSDFLVPILGNDCKVANDAKISEVFYTAQNAPITGDPSLAASWTARLSNSSDGSGTAGNVANPIRHLIVDDGEKPAVTPTYKKNKAGDIQILDKTARSITYVDDDNSDAKYAFYRKLQENGAVLVFYRAGKHFYGGSAGVGKGVGIKGTVKPSYGIVAGADGMAHRWTVSVEWDATIEEDRFPAPF